jgi:hypothetical protein
MDCSHFIGRAQRTTCVGIAGKDLEIELELTYFCQHYL